MEQLVGGWEFTGIYNFQSGNPIVLPTNSAFYRGDKSPEHPMSRRAGPALTSTPPAFAAVSTKSNGRCAVTGDIPPGRGVSDLYQGATWEAPVRLLRSCAKNGVYNDFTVRNTLYPQTLWRHPPALRQHVHAGSSQELSTWTEDVSASSFALMQPICSTIPSSGT